MSVTIHWRPISDKGRHFEGGTSTDLDRLKRVFGNTISKEDSSTLRAMGVAAHNLFYDEVAGVVEQVGAIEFWGEY